MPKTFHVTAPDGHVLEITGPDDATEEQALAQAQSMYKPVDNSTLMQSRQQMSASEFERNQPKQTVGSAIREGILAIPGAEALGNLLRNPVETLKGAKNAAVNLHTALMTPSGLAQTVQAAPEIASGIGQTLIEGPRQMQTGLRESNPEAFMQGLVKTAAITAPTIRAAGEGAMAAGEALTQKADAAKIFNRVANVPAGRKGAETALATGEIKTNPGNAALRALDAEGATPLQKIKAAVFARPTPELQVKVYGELQNAGKALGDHLATSTATIDISDSVPVELKKVQVALARAGVDPASLSAVTPTQAHAIRSDLGHLVPASSWGVESPVPATEQLKDAYFQIGSKIDEAVPGVGPFNKRWQEDFLYSKALKTQLDKVAAGAHRPLSAAQKAAVAAGSAGATAVGAYEYLKK